MHEFITDHIGPNLGEVLTPVKVSVTFHAPVNYGDVRFIKKKQQVSWKPPPDDYVARWDIDNLSWPWIKAILDTIVQQGLIENDTVEQIQSVQYHYIPCLTLDERKIVLQIETLNVVDETISGAERGRRNV